MAKQLTENTPQAMQTHTITKLSFLVQTTKLQNIKKKKKKQNIMFTPSLFCEYTYMLSFALQMLNQTNLHFVKEKKTI